MRFTPAKAGICFSLLIHGGILSGYYSVSMPVQRAVELPQHQIFKLQIVHELPADSTSPDVFTPAAAEMRAATTLQSKPAAAPNRPAAAQIPPFSDEQKSGPSAFACFQLNPFEDEIAEQLVTPTFTGGSRAEMSVTSPPGYRLNPHPTYPKESLKRKEQGLVLLSAQIDSDGFPNKIEVAQSSRFPLLDEAAINALRHWRFTPARVGSVAVPSSVEVPIRFELGEHKK